MHHYIVLGMVMNNAERREIDSLNRKLIGRPRVDRPSLVDERAGFVPPSWWRGDDYASQSALLARVTMKRR